MNNEFTLNIPIKYFNTVCRICLTESELLIPIHEINFTYNVNCKNIVETISLVKVFLKYCDVTVHMDDNKPQKICEKCTDALSQAYNIFELFLESNALFDSLLLKNQTQKVNIENSALIFNKNTELDIVPSTVKPMVSKENGSNENTIDLPEAEKQAWDITSDTDFLNINNDNPMKKNPLENKICFSLNNMKDVTYEFGSTSETTLEYPEGTQKIPPICFIDPHGLLRDHTYSVSERHVFTLLKKGLKCKKTKPARPNKEKSKKQRKKRPKIVKIPTVGDFKKRKLEKKQKLENPTFICRFCEIELQGIENVIEHIKEKHMATTRCILCPKIFQGYYSVIIHMKHHAKYGVICRRCLLFFKDKKSFELHKESVKHNEPFSCKICKKTYSSHKRFRIHMEGMHAPSSRKRFQCNVCGLMMRWGHNLSKHMLTHQDIEIRKKYLCQYCARSFLCLWSLNFHIKKVHEGQTHLRRNGKKSPITSSSIKSPLKCEICAKIIKTSSTLFQHRLTHPEAAIDCPYCDKVLDNPEKYLKHRHEDHISFMCEVCQKGFPTSALLSKHKSIYHRQETYKCTECNATLKTQINYKYHQLKHSGQRPYKCEYCGQGFRQYAHKASHIDCMHKQKKFNCGTCGKAFIFESSLKTHMRTHTGKKPFICPFCKKAFRDTITRHKHVKQEHSDRMEEFLIYKKTHQNDEVRQADYSDKTKNVFEEVETEYLMEEDS